MKIKSLEHSLFCLPAQQCEKEKKKSVEVLNELGISLFSSEEKHTSYKSTQYVIADDVEPQ